MKQRRKPGAAAQLVSVTDLKKTGDASGVSTLAQRRSLQQLVQHIKTHNATAPLLHPELRIEPSLKDGSLQDVVGDSCVQIHGDSRTSSQGHVIRNNVTQDVRRRSGVALQTETVGVIRTRRPAARTRAS